MRINFKYNLMKKLSILFCIVGLMSSCATYNVSILDANGNVMKEHKTKKLLELICLFLMQSLVH